MKPDNSLLKKVFLFYYDGFLNMSSWGRKMWLILIIKLFIIFAVLKLFFFKDFLSTRFDDDKQKSEYVYNQLVNPPDSHD